MSTLSHQPAMVPRERPDWLEAVRTPELWASLAIMMMWIAVLVCAIYGPDFVSTSSPNNSTTIPSAIFVALFAFLGTAAVAKYAFRHEK